MFTIKKKLLKTKDWFSEDCLPIKYTNSKQRICGANIVYHENIPIQTKDWFCYDSYHKNKPNETKE